VEGGGTDVKHRYVELSGESLELATAEAVSAVEALGGRLAPPAAEIPGLLGIDLPDAVREEELARRLGLARRIVTEVARGAELPDASRQAGATGASAVFRPLGSPSGVEHPLLLALGRAFKDGGGRIDLSRPARKFWLATDRVGATVLLEEVGTVDRGSVSARRMPQLPFQRPVSLPPRLARAAANLARIRPGDRVIDPFLGTGALLGEAGLLGARVYGIDRDAAMVRGAIRNFEYLGVGPEELRVGDAGTVDFTAAGEAFDAVLTDPPYGRSSSTGGEAAADLVRRVLPRWAERVRPGGRVVLVTPQGAAPLPAPWEVRVAVPVRVHRSLTREFRAYERSEPDRGTAR
jgi:putative methyltransferase (TIGR01177 family)